MGGPEGIREGGGGYEAEGGLKQPFRLKQQCCAFSVWHKLIQYTKEANTGLSSSLVPHAVLLMPLRTMKCPLWFHSINKKPSVKADLAIYSLVLGVSG